MRYDTIFITPIPSIVVVVTERVGEFGLKGQLAVFDFDTEDRQITDWHGLFNTLDDALSAAHASVTVIAQIMSAERPDEVQP